MSALYPALACLACAAGLVVAEARQAQAARAALKSAASALFILTALAAGGLASGYGQIIVAGLILCALGDVLLLSAAARLFLAGMAAFALGHGAYIAAFLLTGPDAGLATAGAAVFMGGFSFIMLRWLWPHLGDFRLPVIGYVVIISVMAAASIPASLAARDWRIGAGAVLFAISDIAVARDRFIKDEFRNRLWGLPLYYGAQLFIASSV